MSLLRAQPLDGMIAAEKDWAGKGYDGALLTLGQVKGKQYGMGFSLSTPIIYFNADLVKKAGGDPKAVMDALKASLVKYKAAL